MVNNHFEFEVLDDEHKMRLDKVLSAYLGEISRARLKRLILEGEVLVDGEAITKPSIKLEKGMFLSVNLPPPVDDIPRPQDIALDVVYEDEDLLVINKQVGLVVHQGAGHRDGTLVNALLHHCGDSLSGIGGVKRPGIVHRLDQDTSGLMLVAKNDMAHQSLSSQLEAHTVSRGYHAIVLGVPIPPLGKIETLIGRSPGNRLKQAVLNRDGKRAVTHYKAIETFHESFSLVECFLETGRTHQIRVHLAHKKYPIIGDRLYGPQPTAMAAKLKHSAIEKSGFIEAFPRQALHAKKISFEHPKSGKTLDFECDYPSDMKSLITALSS